MKGNFFLERYKTSGHNLSMFKLKSSIRVNTLKISEKELVMRLTAKGIKLDKIPFTDYGYYVDSKFSIGSTPEYLQGYYYLQEAASQVPVQILNCKEEDIVLDACASPGGKTTQIAQYMHNKGKIIALEFKKSRLESLRNNLARLGVCNTIVYNLDAKNVGELSIMFDKILLDAPCSGNLITDEKWLEKRDLDGVKNNAKVQKQLLESSINVLKKDGELVYSTCSLEPEEDEDVVGYAINNLPVELVEIKEERYHDFNNKTLPGTLKFWPDISKTQGFFVAKFRKV